MVIHGIVETIMAVRDAEEISTSVGRVWIFVGPSVRFVEKVVSYERVAVPIEVRIRALKELDRVLVVGRVFRIFYQVDEYHDEKLS